MQHPTTCLATSPLEYARGVAGHCLLLHSATRSLLFYDALETCESVNPAALKSFLGAPRGAFETPVAGYLGYPLKNAIETLPEDAPSWIEAPPVWLVKWASVLVFDHGAHTVTCHGNPPPTPQPYVPAHVSVASLASNMDKATYLAHVADIVNRIHAGVLYQTNLTRKFFGNLSLSGAAIDLFEQLTRISPAPYSAYFKWEERQILSSSPECFITVAADGTMVSRPIKGTLPRGRTPAEDRANQSALAASVKDRAENLMIVDLMRNDFSKVCTLKSVRVPALHAIESYAQVHHMVSTVEGALKHGATAMDAALACFPPGSMTGAPKIRAMQVCSELEQVSRGIYSGALGWFGGDGSADLSVVIRTLVVQGNRFEFQVGGGIVADSIPAKELEETYAKAAGIADLLGIAPTLTD